jgi:hypothetical protein
MHKSVWVLPDFFLKSGVALKVGSKIGMAVYEFPSLYERGILSKLLGGFAMTIHKSVEIAHIPASRVAISRIFADVETLFLMHKCVRISSDVISNSWMVLQKGLQSWVAANEIPAIQKRRISANLLADLAVIVEKMIELRQFAASIFISLIIPILSRRCVVVLVVLIVLTALIGLSGRGCRASRGGRGLRT